MLSTSDDAVDRFGSPASGRRRGSRRTITRGGHRGANWSGLGREAAAAGRRLALPAIALVTVMVGLGLLVVHVLAKSWVGTADLAADRDLAAEHTAPLNSVTAVFTMLASTPVIIGLTAVAALGFRLAYGRWRESVFVVCCVAGETSIFLLTTLLVHRNRPPVTHLDVAPPTSDFPSGHTAAAVCFYGAVAAVVLLHHRQALLRGAAIALAVLLPLLVGTSRLYRGMHFPTDVLAGLLLGTSWLTLTTRRFLHREPAGGARR